MIHHKTLNPIPPLGFLFILVLSLVADTIGQTKSITFAAEKPDSFPTGFTSLLTGQGRRGNWVVRKDDTLPDRGNVLAQLDRDSTVYRFPLCIYERFTARDVDVTVKFKPENDPGDHAGGIVWRFLDKDNYYLVRANTLKNDVIVYHVKNGKRKALKPVGMSVNQNQMLRFSTGQWNTLRINAKGNVFSVYCNGIELYEVVDSVFRDPGKVGLWTKADSVFYFADLQIEPLGQK